MKIEHLRIQCGSNDEYDLQECFAFVSKETLIDILALMKRIREQKESSSVLKDMDTFHLGEFPGVLYEPDGISDTVGIRVDEDTMFVESFKEQDDIDFWKPSIWCSDLVLFDDSNPDKTEMGFYYRMDIRDCSTVVTTRCISEDDLEKIIGLWNKFDEEVPV